MAPLCHPNARFASQAQRALARACRPCFTASRTAPRLAPGVLAVVRAAKTPSQPASQPLYQPTSAKDAIETATRVFKEEQDLNEAIRLYRVSMEMKPSEDEARAALYNLGCALAKQKKWSEATASIVTAINDYKLKLYVALKDDDLKQLRERREWLDAVAQVKGGLTPAAKADMRTEAKAPFRLPRVILFGGLLAGAAIGLLVILARLAKALQGGADAPDLNETLTNLGVNSGAIALLSLLLYRDIASKEKAMRVTTREELMGRLQLDLGGDKVLPLLQFRGQVRPVILAGSRVFVEGAVREAEREYLNLRERAVSVIPIIFDSPASKPAMEPEDKLRMLKKELQKEGKGFGVDLLTKKVESDEPKARKVKVVGGLVEADKKWRLEPYDIAEWKAWVLEQKEFSRLPASEPNCFIQVQLDGTVRASGVGMPPWRQLVEDLPLLSDFRTRLMDGIGPNSD